MGTLPYFNSQSWTQKSNKGMMAGTSIRDTKREGQRKAKRCITCKNKKKEKASPSRGKKLFHS